MQHIPIHRTRTNSVVPTKKTAVMNSWKQVQNQTTVTQSSLLAQQVASGAASAAGLAGIGVNVGGLGFGGAATGDVISGSFNSVVSPRDGVACQHYIEKSASGKFATLSLRTPLTIPYTEVVAVRLRTEGGYLTEKYTPAVTRFVPILVAFDGGEDNLVHAVLAIRADGSLAISTREGIPARQLIVPQYTVTYAL